MLFLLELLLLMAVVSANYQKTTPKRFAVASGALPSIATAAANFAFRFGSGAFASGYKVSITETSEKSKNEYNVLKALDINDGIAGFMFKEEAIEHVNRPKEMLQLYEFEGCPFCKKVREAVTILDLDVLFYPCPRGGPTFRPKVLALGGKAQFPYLVDPNTSVQMYESQDIIEYLYATYGNQDEEVSSTLAPGFLTTLSCSLALAPRAGRGSKFQESRQPRKPLVLWGYEASPFVKVVRERLCELELPHVLKTCARGSPKRQELYKLTGGTFQVPYLIDDNTNVSLFESQDIIAYLDATYAVGA